MWRVRPVGVIRTTLAPEEIRRRIDRHIGSNAKLDAAGESEATDGRTWQDGFRVRYEVEDVDYVAVGRVIARENHSLILLRIRRLRDSLLWTAGGIGLIALCVIFGWEHPVALVFAGAAAVCGVVVLPHLQIVPTKVAEGIPDQLARELLGESRGA